MDGVDAEPSANSIVCAPLVTTTVPLVAGNVSVVVPDSAGDDKVTLLVEEPIKTIDAII